MLQHTHTDAIIALDVGRQMLTEYRKIYVDDALGDSCGLSLTNDVQQSSKQLTFRQVGGMMTVSATDCCPLFVAIVGPLTASL